MSDARYKRKDYENALPAWELVSDVCAGELAVKSKGQKYLPKPNPRDNSPLNNARYEQYKTRAVFFNATGRTLAGLVGAAFRVAPSADIPSALEYLHTDANGAGVSIYQQSQSALGHVLQKGRHALYVDYPATQSPATLAQQRAGLIRANIISVNAENVINWRTELVGGVHRLSLVVIQENVEEIDGFGVADVTQWRVLQIVEGVYTVTVWRVNDKDELYIYSQAMPLDGAGRNWEIIPFLFIGAQNNDANIDQPPLLDLSLINVAHYRNSADYEDSVFFVGQVQPYITGLDEQWRDWISDPKHPERAIYIGSRTPILLPSGSTFGLAQAQPNMIVREAMQDKERQMVALGARLISKGEAVKTATEAQAENEVEHSVLSLCVQNVSEAYIQAIRWCARFMNSAADSVEYAINTKFAESTFNPQALTALIQAWQAGRIPSADVTANLQRMGIISSEKTAEEVADELASDGAGLGLDNLDGVNHGNASSIS